MPLNLQDIIKLGFVGSGSGGGSSGGGGIPQADIDAAFAALAEKGVTVPDGATSADLDDLIASIVTGGGGSDVTIQTGSVTFAETTKTYNFVEGSPDIFFVYATPVESKEHNNFKYVWVQVQNKETGVRQTYGYNAGSYKYYAPYFGTVGEDNMGMVYPGSYNASLGPATYNWIAIWGV